MDIINSVYEDQLEGTPTLDRANRRVSLPSAKRSAARVGAKRGGRGYAPSVICVALGQSFSSVFREGG